MALGMLRLTVEMAQNVEEMPIDFGSVLRLELAESGLPAGNLHLGSVEHRNDVLRQIRVQLDGHQHTHLLSC